MSTLTLSAMMEKTRALLASAERLSASNDLPVDAMKELIDCSRATISMGADDEFHKMVLGGISRLMDSCRRYSNSRFVIDQHSLQRRLSPRHVFPILNVEIDGLVYQSANWSSRGLMVHCDDDRFQLGQQINCLISCEGIPGTGTAVASVLRYHPETRELALLIRQPATVLLLFKARMYSHGITPVPSASCRG